MASPKAIADIINGSWETVLTRCNSYQIRQLHAIRSCRTSALGGHIYECNKCSKQHIRYNSCRNRYCPRCQHTEKERWISARTSELIACKYYHVVFTLPHHLNELCLTYPRQMYALLFRCGWKTLESFGWNSKYIGGQIGSTMVLHTWGSNMSYHPHIHCIVPGGGIDLKNRWRDAKGNGKFLFPVKAMSQVFRGKYVEALEDFLEKEGMFLPKDLKDQLYKKPWVVYAKPPFGGPKAVIQYLARYTHATAISHHRIKKYSASRVTFNYTDYRHKNQKKQLTLSIKEFIRRFVMHILPKGFTRIRHYGLLSSRWKIKIFPEKEAVTTKDWTALWFEKGLDVSKCPYCYEGRLVYQNILLPKRGPPPRRSSKRALIQDTRRNCA